jgi:hypothetical protein
VVELYPRAAVLTAWLNAMSARAVADLTDCPAAQPTDPFHGSEAGVPGWQHARMPLGAALAALAGTGPAFCALPVPGDAGGLPAGLPRAAGAGQAMIIPLRDAAIVITPTSVAGDRTVWHATRAAPVPMPSTDLRSERLRIMELLTEAVHTAAAATLPVADSRSVEHRLERLRRVPMPPGSAGAAVELARSSATLLAIVDGAVTALPDHGSDAAQVRSALTPLGAAGRRGLAVAFSQAGGPDRRSRVRT